MKLNCDMGESFGAWTMGNDAEVMPYIDMANIACGLHASDPQIMRKTVALAVKHDVEIGAHPGYPDLLGFGRREMSFAKDEIENLLLYQIGALQAICKAQNTRVSYVKPHGAMYNAMMKNHDVMAGVLSAIAKLEFQGPLMVLSNDQRDKVETMAESYGISLIFEAFCDRAYTHEGNLMSRSLPGAVHDTMEKIEGQAEFLISHQKVHTVSGEVIDIKADTLCIHGDNPLAPEMCQRLRTLIGKK